MLARSFLPVRLLQTPSPTPSDWQFEAYELAVRKDGLKLFTVGTTVVYSYDVIYGRRGDNLRTAQRQSQDGAEKFSARRLV